MKEQRNGLLMLKADTRGQVMECGENPLVTLRIAPRLMAILSYLIES